MNKKKKPLSLYLHIPFCVRKCYYCDFPSFPAEEQTKKAYLDALMLEIKESDFLTDDYEVETVFLGGGTPSLLSVSELSSLTEAIYKRFSFVNHPEMTLECNPATVNSEKLKGFYQLGYQRLSIGLQSAQEEELKQLGRIHTRTDFIKTYNTARMVGFSNLNIDLMTGIPGQTLTSYQDTLCFVLSLQPEHISAYSLILEEGTPFYNWFELGKEMEKKKAFSLLPLPSEEEEYQLYQETKRTLEEAGLHRYEISNYAKPGFACQHNIGTWERRDYLGFGLSAASCFRETRFRNCGELPRYLKQIQQGETPGQEKYKLNTREQMEEFFFLGLRQIKGVSKRQFFEKFKCSPESIYEKVFRDLSVQGLLERNKDSIFLTELGLDVSNVALAEFLG